MRPQSGGQPAPGRHGAVEPGTARRDLRHPLWDVYDKQRTARLNAKYYGVKLRRTRRASLWMETLIALSTSSVVAGLRLWQQPPWRTAWEALAVIAALLAILKPLLRQAGRIQLLQEVIKGYQVLDHDLDAIAITAHQRNTYDAELRDRFAGALARMRDLIPKEPEEPVDSRLRGRCATEVQKELPAARFFVPEGGSPRGDE